MNPDSETIELSQLLLSVKPSCVAYFSAEFAVDANLPIYAGGLGVLAGDILAQAGEEGRSFVGVGLLYHKGYLRQQISKEANTFGEDPFDYKKAGLQLVVDKGANVTVSVPIHGRKILIKCWVKMVNGVPLLLLDTQVEGNEAQDQLITDRLYYGDREHRLKQEMVLGIGGRRMLAALQIHPSIYHLNEGHSALLLFELARERCCADTEKRAMDVLTQMKNVVFTNHTLVPAGNDVFSKDLVVSYLSSYALEFPIDPIVLTNIGLIQDSSLFSPTMLALRLATVPQAVSKIHAQKAKDVWTDHPMIAITNGVRQSFWQDPTIAQAVLGDDAALFAAHTACKKRLCEYVKELTGTAWNENDFIIGWARRLASYKRPLLLFEDLERFKTIVSTYPIPIRVVISGKPHPTDEQGMNDLMQILRDVGDFNGQLVYVQDYNLDVAKHILSGIDVLLNTPIRGMEACGTSGMKASMNGVLQCTTLDGWTDEVDWKEKGWVLDETRTSESLYEKLSNEILPSFAQREGGVPKTWVYYMRNTIDMAVKEYSAHRLLTQLEEMVYKSLRTTQ